MSTQTVRTLIRLAAGLMVVAGIVGVSVTLVGAVGAVVIGRTMGLDIARDNNIGGVTLYGALLWVVPVFWGVALYQLSPLLASLVTSEPQPQAAPAPELRPGTTER